MRKILLSFLLLLFCASKLWAQYGDGERSRMEIFQSKIKKAPKVLTYGWSIIDDNGKAFTNVILPKSFTTNFIPFTFNYDLYYDRQMFFNFKTSFCNFRRGKMVNGRIVEDANLLFAFDFNTSLSLNSYYYFSDQVDFRILAGIGYTNRNIYVFNHAANVNFGGGTYIRFNKKFGMHLEIVAKFGLRPPLIRTNTNYVHTGIGFSYFIRSVKYSPRGRR